MNMEFKKKHHAEMLLTAISPLAPGSPSSDLNPVIRTNSHILQYFAPPKSSPEKPDFQLLGRDQVFKDD